MATTPTTTPTPPTTSSGGGKIALSVIPSPPDPPRLPVDFVICDCPPVPRLADYVQAFHAHHVTDVVRVCDRTTYDEQVFEQEHIRVHDFIKFQDGGVPDDAQVYQFLDWFAERLALAATTTTATTTATAPATVGSQSLLAVSPSAANASSTTTRKAIAVHCVSGLGRAPVLIAILLLEYVERMEVLDTVEYLRKYRRGALNRVQLRWLEETFDKKLRRKQWKKRTAKYRRVAAAIATNTHTHSTTPEPVSSPSSPDNQNGTAVITKKKEQKWWKRILRK